jgi:hypothetical protein
VSLIADIEAGAEQAGAGTDGSRAWVLEAVREGYLMHYGEPRAFEGLDDDLKLLGGDALYALGLARLADEGDLEAVAELADLISASAQAEADGRPTGELWAAAAERLGAGGRAPE